MAGEGGEEKNGARASTFALYNLLEDYTFTFMYVCPLDVLHGTCAHLNMPKMDTITGKDAL